MAARADSLLQRGGPDTSSACVPPFPFVQLRAMGTRPSVSVLITNYNYGQYIGEAIESALNQSMAPDEVIVADDGSEDESCRIVEGYAAQTPSVRLLRNPHSGMAACLNAAFAAACGEVVCLLDADDFFFFGKIAGVVAACRAAPQAGLIIHRAQMIDRRGRRRGLYPLVQRLPQGECARATWRNAGILMGLPPTSNLALRRQVADCIFPLPARFTGYAEQVIHRIAPLITNLAAINRPLAAWRLHGGNDGNSNRVAPGRLERELGYMSDLWQIQREFLAQKNPSLGEAFPGIENSLLYLRMRYMLLRLRRDPESFACHGALCALNDSHTTLLDLFWKLSIYLPLPVFRKCVDLLQTQNVLKEWAGRMIRRQP